MRTPLAADTPLEVEERQLEAWRRMTPAEKADIVVGLSRAADEMTWAGVRHRYPGATDREVFLRVAIVRLGAELAVAAYPEAAQFISS